MFSHRDLLYIESKLVYHVISATMRAALSAYMNGGVFNYLTAPSYQLHLNLPVLLLIAWVEVFSILTDFSFFGKGPDSS